MKVSKEIPNKTQPNQASTNEYYSTLAKEVYGAAKRERWTPDRVRDMFKNPK